MTKDKWLGLSVVGALMIVIGIVLLFNSVDFGTSMADKWLFQRGGIEDTGAYQLIWKSYVTNFQVSGGILLSFGLILGFGATFKL